MKIINHNYLAKSNAIHFVATEFTHQTEFGYTRFKPYVLTMNTAANILLKKLAPLLHLNEFVSYRVQETE